MSQPERNSAGKAPESSENVSVQSPGHETKKAKLSRGMDPKKMECRPVENTHKFKYEMKTLKERVEGEASERSARGEIERPARLPMP